MTTLINAELNEEQRVVFMEVIEESLHVKLKTDMFNWLQRGIQFLIGHDVIVYGLQATDSAQFDFEYLTTTLEFSEKQFQLATEKGDGIVHKACASWHLNNMPVFVTPDLPTKEHNNYNVLNISAIDSAAYALDRFVMHGYADMQSRISSVVILGRINAPINAVTAHLLQLLMPYIHSALVKVYANRGAKQFYGAQQPIVNNVTKRELEVLRWVHTGKTNWEISSILGISQTTVKNHVQNIIRKLGVENRRQAAIKGLKQGLIAPMQS